MKLVIISDTHDKLIKSLPRGDVLIHCGDYSVFGEYDETKKFFDWFDSQPHKYKIVIPGNHEVGICPLKKRPDREKTMELIKSYENINFLVDEKVVIDGVTFYGTPWCGGESYIMSRWGYYMEHDENRAQIFKYIPEDTDVLISHSPPFNILDRYDNRVLGCPALLERIKQVKPLVNCFGHIHSANGYKEVNGTHFFNCSNLGENYKVEYPCRVVEIKNGLLVSNVTVPVVDIEHKSPLERLLDEIVAARKPKTVTYMGQEYPPIPDEINLPPSVFKPNPDDNKTKECIYCNVTITDDNYGFTTMRGSMCMRCTMEIYD